MTTKDPNPTDPIQDYAHQDVLRQCILRVESEAESWRGRDCVVAGLLYEALGKASRALYFACLSDKSDRPPVPERDAAE